MTDITVSPYYDDYDPSKGYTQILALPGRVEQSREFTQVQTMLLDFLARFSNSLLKDGSIVQGCDFVDVGTNNVIITAGKVYLQGIVRDVPETTVTISKVGAENIGIVLTSSIVTEEQDNSLLDPADTEKNYMQPGAHRVKQVVSVVANTTGSAIIYRLQDGKIYVNTEKPYVDTMMDILAKRTYDESGNYRVSGFNMTAKGKYNDTLVYIDIEGGRAYVLGYMVEKPSSTTLAINKALTIRSVVSEPKVYNTGTSLYALSNVAVKDITQLVAVVQVTQSITRGSTVGGIDYLPQYPVVDIITVQQGATTYNKTTDFLVTSDGINWSPGGIEPAIGTSYNVTWQYNKILQKGTDYTLSTDSSTWYAELLGPGVKPVNGSTFQVNYDFYLGRKDLICLNKDGDFVVIEGQPDIERMVTVPSITDDSLLRIGTVYLRPNSNDPLIVNYAVTRMPMDKIYSLLNRIETLEYNDAILSLDDEAMTGESASTLKGILTDGFIGFQKADIYHSNFDSSLDLGTGTLCLPFSSTMKVPTVNTPGSSIQSSKRLIFAPYNEVVSINQSFATEVMLVNPYQVYNKSSVISLTPSIDNWIDESTVNIDGGTVVSTDTFRRWWYHQGESWAEEERKRFMELGFADGGASLQWEGTEINNDVTGEKVLEESIMYMRQKTIAIEGHNFIPGTDNLVCTFDGIQVTLTPQSGTYQGTAAGTVKADSSGKVYASFTIPAGVKTGVREVVLYNANNTSSDVYTSEGRKRTTERTVTHYKTILTPVDPLAQSFSFDKTTVVTSTGFYFASKDSTLPVIVQIRNMVNGYPGVNVLAEKVVYPVSIQVSGTGTLETKVSFDDPVICEKDVQYCTVLLTDSSVYSVFVSNLADKDLISGEYVSKQAYNAGVLFSSSNALTWTAHQTKDLKFKVYTAAFTGNGSLVFNTITGISINRFLVAANFITPGGSECTWEYKINGGAWLPFSPYAEVQLSTVATTLDIKATIKTRDNACGVILAEAFNVVGYLNGTSGAYVTKNVALSQSSTIIKQVIDAYKPSGCVVDVYFATDTTGTTWTKQTSVTVEPIENSVYSRYIYSYTLGVGTTNFRAKIVMTTPSAAIEPKVRRFMNIIK